MFTRCVCLAGFLALAIGCSKKSSESTESGPAPGPTGDPAQAYAIKLRHEQKGDKFRVVKSRDGSTTVTAGGKSQTQADKYRYDYTETVIEMPEGAPKPTRSDRAYAVAEKSDETGELKALSYSGKTVEVQVSPFEGIGYIFIVGGNAIQPPEVDEFNVEFQGGTKPGVTPLKPRIDALMPKNAVKVGEEWAADFSSLNALMGQMPFALDKEKSTITGKLARAYRKDGKQWGVIELKVVMAVVPGGKGPPLTGTITADITLDRAIDGSTNAGTTKLTGGGTLSFSAGKGQDVKMEMKITQDESVTPVK